MGVIILPSRNSLIKPPVGAQINQGHPLAQGLVRCYLTNEGAGGYVLDLVGNKHGQLGAGTPAYCPTWIAGKDGSALHFDHSNDLINLGTDDLALGGVATIEAQIRWTDATNAWEVVVFLGTKASAQGIYITKSGSDGTKIVVGVYAETTAIDFGPLNDGNWHDIVGTFYPTNQRAINVDGKGVASGTSSLTINETGTINLVGALDSYWSGDIGKVCIWNRALTSAEIAWLYAEPYCFLQSVVRRYYSIPEEVQPYFRYYPHILAH